ncbi:hypothetical protein POPTR_001G112250v4 [Populus trichocarpa]|jgi:hypothetical protein|uniref:Uncharacterized protein n=1 Tax=Populus trichocarpa TaxID=3694 RepID=A0ACC0TIG9_POPTR|nr:hypothetical protein POPTR_001G112250v4 [Populus trichocarpa]
MKEDKKLQLGGVTPLLLLLPSHHLPTTTMLLLSLGITLITIISFHFLFKIKKNKKKSIFLIPSLASLPLLPPWFFLGNTYRFAFCRAMLIDKVLSGFPRCIYVVDYRPCIH